MSENAEETANLITTAEKALAGVWGGSARLEPVAHLREKGRNRVIRCNVTDALADSPSTVIVKASFGEGDDAFAASKDDLGSTAWRFYNECAGTALLGGIATDSPLSPRLYATDKSSGLIVAEDLGSGECLADRMQATDPAALETGLFAYARSLGRMHAATIGQESQFLALRQKFGDSEGQRETEGVRWLRENVELFKAHCESLQIAMAPGFDAEITEVQQSMDAPGPFLAFSPCDTCPDNHRIVGEDAVCFFDFEFCGFRHALLDAAYLRAPFPTCWCVNRLPADLIPRLESTYRAELVKGCPEAGEDATFYTALVQANAYWAISTVSWNLKDALEKDGPWGISTVRQRHPMRLSNFADVSEQFGILPALGATARALAAKLRDLWSDEEPMPLYPAFRA